MSHVSQIEIEIKDLEALKAACQRLGFEFRAGQTTYKWFGRFVGDYPMPQGFKVEDLGKCTHAIRVPEADYEIGVVIRDGKTTLLWDFWHAGGLERVVGKNGAKLKQAYAAEATKRAARKAGYMVTEKHTLLDRIRGTLGMQQVDGIRLTLRRM
jgi:hypothetical protein